MSVNRLSLDITDAQKATVATDTNKLADSTEGFNVVIDKEELKSLSKISDGRIPFVEKVTQYIVSNPEFLPPFADVPEFQKDFKAFKDLREMSRPLRQILDKLETSMMVAGSEAYDTARNYYKTVQFQAKMGVPGAQTIYEDLRQLFEVKTTAPEPEE
jgi:hypothetical protein